LNETIQKGKRDMTDQAMEDNVQSAEAHKLTRGDPFFELVQEVNDLIAQRAHELYEASGSVGGRDRENRLRAESEILLRTPVDIAETETGLTIRADVPGFSEQDLEVRFAPRSLCISGKRAEVSQQSEGKTIYSERRSNRVLRVLDLPFEIDPDKVDATLTNGILEVTLSRVGAGRKIPVRAKAATA
jgi:HSP20 family protein